MLADLGRIPGDHTYILAGQRYLFKGQLDQSDGFLHGIRHFTGNIIQTDQCFTDLGRGILCFRTECPDLVCDNGETFSCLSCSCSLNGSIQGKKVCLAGDIVDLSGFLLHS